MPESDAIDFRRLDDGALRFVVEASSDGIMVVDTSGVIEYASPSAQRLLSRSSDDLVGHEFGVPLVPGKPTDIEIELDIPRPGSIGVCELRTTKATFGGRAVFVVGLRDVTDSRKLVEEYDRVRREALALAGTKSALLDMVAHEFRTPLAVIVGWLSILDEEQLGPVPQEWRAPLETVLAKTDELKALLNDVLVAGRLEAGRMAAERTDVNIQSVAESAASRARPRADLLGGRIEVTGPDAEAPLIAVADERQVGMILDNLINNGLSYSGTEAPVVQISTGRLDGHVLLRISDVGAGIPEDLHEKIFERFERGQATADTGTGLGLAIARDIAVLNRGMLKLASSEVGVGSCFELYLPASDGSSAAAETSHVADPDTPATTAATHNGGS